MSNKHSKRRRRNQALIILACFVLGLLLATQLKSVSQLKSLNILGNDSVEELQDQILNLSLANNELRERNASLNENLKEVIQLGDNESAQLNFYQQEIQRLSVYAGLTDVKGPGMIIDIKLSASSANIKSGTLLVLLNRLKGNGAYAISVNDQRVVALTDISETGSADNPNIIMNGTNITSTEGYEIRVIGEVKKMQDFVSFHTNIWDNIKSYGATINFHYPAEVEIKALAKDSPAYRQQLLEPVE